MRKEGDGQIYFLVEWKGEGGRGKMEDVEV
jgi:hypothetical protein